jgi:hypothetical protein
VNSIANRNLSLAEWRRFFPDVTYRPTFLSLPAPEFGERYKEIARNLTQADWPFRERNHAQCRSINSHH